jgi:hypothetical protein
MAWMSNFTKSDLSVKKVDRVVSGILALFVEDLVFQALRACVTTRFSEQLLGWLRMSCKVVLWVRSAAAGLKQTSWDGISQKQILLFRNLKQQRFECKINNVKKTIMNSCLKSERSDVCEHTSIYSIILNWIMATGRSSTAVQIASCANTHPKVEWWYGSTTFS